MSDLGPRLHPTREPQAELRPLGGPKFRQPAPWGSLGALPARGSRVGARPPGLVCTAFAAGRLPYTPGPGSAGAASSLPTCRVDLRNPMLGAASAIPHPAPGPRPPSVSSFPGLWPRSSRRRALGPSAQRPLPQPPLGAARSPRATCKRLPRNFSQLHLGSQPPPLPPPPRLPRSPPPISNPRNKPRLGKAPFPYPLPPTPPPLPPSSRSGD